MAFRKTALAAITLACALLAGCSQPDPDRQPTYTCTPANGTTPYPCHKAQYDAKAKEDALYTEAEQVYRKFLAEDERVHRIGGVTEPTPVILETTTGAFATNVMANFRRLK